MNIPGLLPGEEFIARQENEEGREVVVYAYRTEKGAFFSCVGISEADVRDRCMTWLVTQERHRHQL